MISIIGCTISLIAVLLTITVSLVFWRAVKSPRAKVLLNLCVAVALSSIFVIVEGLARGNKVGFNIQTVFLLFFSLGHLIELPQVVRSHKKKKKKKNWGLGGGGGSFLLLYFLLDVMNVMTVLIPCPLGTCGTSRLCLIPLYFSMQIFSCLRESSNLAANCSRLFYNVFNIAGNIVCF